MPLIDSLIAAVLTSNGDGLIMHVGERPYVLTPTGPTNISDRPLSIETMQDVITDLLTAEDAVTLREVGAVEKDASVAGAPGETFRLVVAQGGDDIWVEFRRLRVASGRQDTAAASMLPGNPLSHSPPPAPTRPTAAVSVPVSQSAPRVTQSSNAAETRAVEPRGVASRAAAPPVPEPRSSQPTRVPTHAKPPERTVPDDDPLQRMTTLPRDVAPGVVLPIARSSIRPEHPSGTRVQPPRHLGVGRLLRTAAARGASSLYLTADARPSIRIDGEIMLLETEPPLSTAEVEALVFELAPGGIRDAFARSNTAEWVCELPDVGRVRCLSFRDQRGPGAVIRLIPTRLVSADQLGLSRDIQALAGERDGLILVAAPRLSGKSTIVSALVDLINRNRSDYVITLETEITFVHENRKSMVSQREVRGEIATMAAGARAALRENPDVLVIDDLRSADPIALALEAAESGHLVIGSVTAHTTMTAIARLIESGPTDRQAHMALVLAETLRGAVAQVLLRKAGGGRVAARELLLNTPSVAALLAEGKVGQLSLAIDSGRKHGMVPLNDALTAFVHSGAVDAREAYRKAYDRGAFVEQLKRDGIDTSFVERLA